MKFFLISFSFALLLAVQAVPPPKYFVAPAEGFGGNPVLVPRSSVSVRQGCNMPETTATPTTTFKSPTTFAPTTFAPATTTDTAPSFTTTMAPTTTSSGDGGSGAPPINPSGPPSGTGPCISCAVENFMLVNEHRIANGLDPVVWNDMLSELSAGWSKVMYDEDRLSISDYRYTENVSFISDVGEGETSMAISERFFDSFKLSEISDDNMLMSTHKCMGVGIYGDGHLYYATQMFTDDCP